MNRRSLVVSAVNLVEGGTLTVLRECLSAARDRLSASWEITAIVHRADIVNVPGIRYIERPDIKRSWTARIWFEYFECRRLSRELKADFWLALHDMTPRVVTPRQAVYCHNAMCFYRMTLREGLMEPKLLLFSFFYQHLYRIHLRTNTAVIVQQAWIREEFKRRFGFQNIIVAHPVLAAHGNSTSSRRAGYRFFYPTLPRIFKNLETLLLAWEILECNSEWCAELVLTIDGSENRYSAQLLRRFGDLRNVRFVGCRTHAEVLHLYEQSDCVVFPSRLETWGLPLTEAKQRGLAILAADLPYAHETVGTYDAVAYFAANDAGQLAEKMRQFTLGKLVFSNRHPTPIAEPFAQDWKSLFDHLLGPQATSPAHVAGHGLSASSGSTGS